MYMNIKRKIEIKYEPITNLEYWQLILGKVQEQLKAEFPEVKI